MWQLKFERRRIDRNELIRCEGHYGIYCPADKSIRIVCKPIKDSIEETIKYTSDYYRDNRMVGKDETNTKTRDILP